MALSAAHRAALDRPRRIIVEYDANDPVELIGSDFDAWLEFRFAFADQPESQIDSIMWELHPSSDVVAYQSDLLPSSERPDLRRWRDAGIDWLARSIEATRGRGIEVWWTHRISEVDLNTDNQLEMQTLSPPQGRAPGLDPAELVVAGHVEPRLPGSPRAQDRRVARARRALRSGWDPGQFRPPPTGVAGGPAVAASRWPHRPDVPAA